MKTVIKFYESYDRVLYYQFSYPNYKIMLLEIEKLKLSQQSGKKNCIAVYIGFIAVSVSLEIRSPPKPSRHKSLFPISRDVRQPPAVCLPRENHFSTLNLIARFRADKFNRSNAVYHVDYGG